jgi:hypothetical protein
LTRPPEIEAATIGEDGELAEEAEFELQCGTRAAFGLADPTRSTLLRPVCPSVGIDTRIERPAPPGPAVPVFSCAWADIQLCVGSSVVRGSGD